MVFHFYAFRYTAPVNCCLCIFWSCIASMEVLYFFPSIVYLKICSLSEWVQIFFSMDLFHAYHAQLGWKEAGPRSHWHPSCEDSTNSVFEAISKQSMFQLPLMPVEWFLLIRAGSAAYARLLLQ